ncbi:MAG: bifunctional folylpolyglutamate synthase/dihydrofolate synthase [Propionibacteriaceae bacterium]|nr:bifunctional folylpolyglutamate synthase/dihydrofolate synthase [Propionibacteriaceae bacterium]
MNHLEISAALQARWPENKVAPSLSRIRALMDLLGEPQRSCPVIQITGTNGKGSTAIMIESLLRALNLRVGRFSSPHLVDVTERISIDGEPIAADKFDELVEEVMPFVEMVDARELDGVKMTFFEVITGLAYQAFADAPVDVAVVEVGMGGTWDATSVADPAVAVVAPIGLDHTHILGSTIEEVATEKAGIIKPGSVAVLAGQTPEAAKILLKRALEVGAEVRAEGPDFGLLDRQLAVGGQVIRINTAEGPLGDLYLPLYGDYMAQNAALAVAAVEAFLGGRALAPDVIEEGLAAVKAPARLELVRTSPSILLDTCHNPQAAHATMGAIAESFNFEPLIGVVALMRDKDAAGVLGEFRTQMTQIVCTSLPSFDRALSADELAERASGLFPPEFVHTADDISAAIEKAVQIADAAGPGAGIIVCGSVYLAGEARELLKKEED